MDRDPFGEFDTATSVRKALSAQGAESTSLSLAVSAALDRELAPIIAGIEEVSARLDALERSRR